MIGHYRWLFPELLCFDGGEARRKALRRAALKVYIGGTFVTGACLIIVVGLSPVIHRYIQLPAWLVAAVAGAVSGLGGYGGVWFARKRIRMSLRRQLIAEGMRVCMQCGYDLRGQDRAQCPECGATFTADDAGFRDPGRD